MSDVLLINVTGHETRLALVENGVLAELYVERQAERGIVGNIYKGRVVRILPGMQAAFVDIGTDRAAFLYVTEVLNEHVAFSLPDDDDEDGTLVAPTEAQKTNGNGRRKQSPKARIEDLLKEGQEILVQAAKDPIGTKGARLTGHITMPGRHLVFMPTVNHIGISRRITAESERSRLRELVEEIRPEGSGFIVRTAAANEPSDHLRRDMEILIRAWQRVLNKRGSVRAPSLLHADFDLILRATRDLASTKVDKIIVDCPDQYRRIPDFIRSYMPGFHCSVELYQGSEPVFEAFGIEMEIDRALQRKVWLKSGGYLVIDQTEALTAIDVNTGKYVGKSSLEETITKTNLEAVEEVVYQLRLRNIGGLIIIDLIDMDARENRDKVYRALSRALESDKARTNLLKISDFGLVQMTRKRVKENLVQQLCEPCAYCEGSGRVKSDATMAYEILRKLERQVVESSEGTQIQVESHTAVSKFLRSNEKDSVERLEAQLGGTIQVRSSRNRHHHDYQLTPKKPRGGKSKARDHAVKESASDSAAPEPTGDGSEERLPLAVDGKTAQAG